MVDLSRFHNGPLDHPHTKAPLNFCGQHAATDGFILVVSDDKAPSGLLDAPPVLVYLFQTSFARKFDYPILPNGIGITRWRCSCSGSACGLCHGTGVRYGQPSTMWMVSASGYDQYSVDSVYIALLRELPGCELSYDHAQVWGPVLFRFMGGRGLVMPRHGGALLRSESDLGVPSG